MEPILRIGGPSEFELLVVELLADSRTTWPAAWQSWAEGLTHVKLALTDLLELLRLPGAEDEDPSELARHLAQVAAVARRAIEDVAPQLPAASAIRNAVSQISGLNARPTCSAEEALGLLTLATHDLTSHLCRREFAQAASSMITLAAYAEASAAELRLVAKAAQSN
jgi:hypothetical protein